MSQEREQIEGIVVVPEKAEELLNQRQLTDYRDHRERLIKWILNLGKDPEKAEGYAWDTARQRSYKIDKFYRWIWKQEDGYTLKATTRHAEEYSKELAYEEYSSTHEAAIQKAVKTLFKFQRFQGKDVEWEPSIQFSSNSGTHNARDFLTRDERRKIKEAVLEYGPIPHYDSLSPKQRDRWKQHLAQRFEKPKSEVTKEDWKRANGWKYPSIVWVSMDAGLRPKEVGRVRVDWLDLENGMLRISKQDSTKNTDNWNVGLSDRTANILRKWVAERKQYDKYTDSDKLWLTKYGNPYGTEALNRLLRKLCEEAKIPVENRDVTWYSIRHSVGTYMAQDNGLAAAQAQLRHKSERTTMRYDQAPVEDRKKTLNNWD
jgi:integrase